MKGNIEVKVPGSCGELIQGRLSGRDFLVSCPVNLFSRVRVTLNKSGEISYPANKWKSGRALRKTLDYFRKPDAGGEIRISSEIPEGKGMASSTADIAGVCLACAAALGESLSEHTVAEIAVSIEPTDGTVFNGLTLFDHRRGAFCEPLGKPPKMKILAIDPGGAVDTLEFNKMDFSRFLCDNQPEIKKALELVKRGIRERDISDIGKGATISARCNQKLLFKPELEKIIELSGRYDAAGTNTAHSGTVIGLFFDPDFDGLDRVKSEVDKLFCQRPRFYELELLGGGGKMYDFSG